VKHPGEFNCSHAVEELDQRPEPRPDKDMVSQILDNREEEE